MKRLLVALAFLLLAAPAAAMQKYSNVAQSKTGAAIANATVTVYQSDGATLATIYSDNGVTTQANPFQTGSDGTYTFYAANGRYVVALAKTGYTFSAGQTSDISLYDSADDVSRSLVVNVKDPAYGAKGDGTDESAKIQAAATAAAGKTLYFPPGTFIFANVKLSSGTHVLGAGTGATTLKLPNAVTDGTQMFEALNTSVVDLELDHFTADGNATGQAAKLKGGVSPWQVDTSANVGSFQQVYFAQFLQVQRVKLHHIYAHDWPDDFALIQGASVIQSLATDDGIEVYNNVLVNIGRNCVTVYGGQGWTIHDNLCVFSQSGIDFENSTTVRRVTIHNNLIMPTATRLNLQNTNRSYGIEVATPGLPGVAIQDVTISGNHVQGSLGTDDATYHPIAISVFAQAGDTLGIDTLTITGNTIDAANTGISDGRSVVPLTPLVIAGNTLTNIHGDGITISGNASAFGNALTGGSSANRGIRCATGATVKCILANNVISAFATGIGADNGTVNGQAIGNTVRSSTGWGALCASGCNNWAFVGNEFKSNTSGNLSWAGTGLLQAANTTDDNTSGVLLPGSVAQANLGSALTVSGQMIYCSDCKGPQDAGYAAGACAGGGTGAFAHRNASTNTCN